MNKCEYRSLILYILVGKKCLPICILICFVASLLQIRVCSNANIFIHTFKSYSAVPELMGNPV